MGEEEWRVVPGSESFEISSLGNIRHIGDDRPLHPGNFRFETWEEDGVPYIWVSEREFGFRGPVWKLFLPAFYRGTLTDVHPFYVDGDPRNVRLDNLGWYVQAPGSEEIKPLAIRGDGFRRLLDRRVAHKVEIVETGMVFESVAACAKVINGQTSNIYACLAGRLETHRGYHFRYV